MKKLLLCASVLSLIGAMPLSSFAANYTATVTPSTDKADVEEGRDELDADMDSEEEKEMTFEDKLLEFNGGDTVLVETRDILKGRLADRDGKAIGEVKEVFIAEGGMVEGITVSLGKISLSGEIFLSAKDMNLEGSSKGYGIALSGSEIKEVFSQLPKGTPDFGNGKVLSSKQFAGRDVKTKKGKDFAEVLEILFSEEGTEVSAALLKISYGPIKNAVVAVPMEALDFEKERGRPSFTIRSDLGGKVLAFAKKQQESGQ